MCVFWQLCGCFGNMCTCISCVLDCVYCVLVLFRLCICILICFVSAGVRTTATRRLLNCALVLVVEVVVVLIIIIIIMSFRTELLGSHWADIHEI